MSEARPAASRSGGFRNGSAGGARGECARGWNKARVLNTTDVHLLAACLPAWCMVAPWTADARRRIRRTSPPSAPRRLCVRACGCVWVRDTWQGGVRVVKQVAPKPRPWAVAVKYCGCFKNRSDLPRPPPTSPALAPPRVASGRSVPRNTPSFLAGDSFHS